jgi:hypothetical protein
MKKLAAKLLRAFRFRLATVFLLITLCSIWLGWISYHARKQRDAVAGLERKGVTVMFSYQKSPDGSFSYLASVPGPAWLRRIIGDDYFRTAVSVTATAEKGPITDAGMRYLADLPSLDRLYISKSGTTDEGIQHIAGLTRLTQLTLRGSQITDDGLRHLKNLRNLELLQLIDNQITGHGLKHLAGMTGLKTLYMYDNPISDEGLSHLSPH